jgi:hypothetical protein
MRFYETKPEKPADEDLGPRPFIINLPTHPDPDTEPEPCQGPCCVRPEATELFT